MAGKLLSKCSKFVLENITMIFKQLSDSSSAANVLPTLVLKKVVAAGN
jgi:hypothetical protein